MGTRSETSIMNEEGFEICRIYRQMDGYPSGHGVELAKLCNVMIINGIGMDQRAGQFANGAGCLAAQVVAGLKDGIGSIYLVPPVGPYNEWIDYRYVVKTKVGKKPTIECWTGNELVFKLAAGSVARWVKKDYNP